MCDFCKKSKDFDTLSLDLKMIIVENELQLSFNDRSNKDDYLSDSSFSTELEINFCPMCGQSLTSESIPTVPPSVFLSL